MKASGSHTIATRNLFTGQRLSYQRREVISVATYSRKKYLRKLRQRRQRERRIKIAKRIAALAILVGVCATVGAVMADNLEGSILAEQEATPTGTPVAGVTAELAREYYEATKDMKAAPETADPDPTPEPQAYTFTDKEEIQLQKIGLAEMEVEGVTAMAHAMRVVINRVESDKFPNTIEAVIFQPKQFTPILNGSYYNQEPNEKSKEALEMIKAGWDETQGALYFEVTTDQPTWHNRTLKKLYEYGRTSFYIDK